MQNVIFQTAVSYRESTTHAEHIAIQFHNGLFHFLSVQGDGRKIQGLVKSMNFQRSTAKSPKIPGGWQHFATKFMESEIFTLTDFSRPSCRCKQEFQGKKGKKCFPGD